MVTVPKWIVLGLTCAAISPAVWGQDNGDLQRQNQVLKAQVRQQQQEIERLENRIRELQSQRHPGTAAGAQVDTPAPMAAAPPPLPVAPPGYRLVKIAPQTAHKPKRKIPAGYKLVKVQPPPAPYSDTGCHHGGFFSAGPDARWKHDDHWLSLQVGMTPKDVERLLGRQHFNVRDGDRIGWEYGKCQNAYRGIVVFSGGQVAYWKKPYF